MAGLGKHPLETMRIELSFHQNLSGQWGAPHLDTFDPGLEAAHHSDRLHEIAAPGPVPLRCILDPDQAGRDVLSISGRWLAMRLRGGGSEAWKVSRPRWRTGQDFVSTPFDPYATFVGSFTILSDGPDRTWNFGEWVIHRLNYPSKNLLYSPTNGTTSSGDLVAWGP